MTVGRKDSLIAMIAPQHDSTIIIYDVHASESGALAILSDLYNQVQDYPDRTVKWVFIVSTPEYKDTENTTVLQFPWIKKSWAYRFYFDYFLARKLVNKINPDQIFSLQNKGVDFYHRKQTVYLHLPFILTEHRFTIKKDGKKLWMYQNVLSKIIFSSLRKVDMIIVQTHWMKTALIEKAHISSERIAILQPDISCNLIGKFIDISENRRRFFYPATSFTYKNHITLLKALKYAQEKGLKDYEVILTIQPQENKYTCALAKYVKENHLKVLMAGPIPRERVFEMYTKSILLFPSYVESFGLPLLEARHTGTYVIASDCPFSREILTGYDKAKYFNAMDYQKLGELVLEIVS